MTNQHRRNCNLVWALTLSLYPMKSYFRVGEAQQFANPLPFKGYHPSVKGRSRSLACSSYRVVSHLSMISLSLVHEPLTAARKILQQNMASNRRSSSHPLVQIRRLHWLQSNREQLIKMQWLRVSHYIFKLSMRASKILGWLWRIWPREIYPN